MRLASSTHPRARMLAEQTATIMDGRLTHKLNAKGKAGLIDALTRVASIDGIAFGSEPFRAPPPRWTLDGMLARLTLRWKRWRMHKWADDGTANDAEALSATHFDVKRSGVIGLLMILAIALFMGAINFGEPLELGLQMGRDGLRRTAASGDIVVIAMDDRSANQFGRWPWPRKYDAMIVDNLRTMGAKKIVYNVAFSQKSDPVNDAIFAAALDRAKGKVWLGVQDAYQSDTGMSKPLLPIKLFRDRTRQHHFKNWFGMFGELKYTPKDATVDGIHYQSQVEILANTIVNVDRIRPDYAITYKSIPTISAVDVAYGRVNRSAVSGKTIVISVVGESQAEIIPVLGQGRASRIYSVVISAETIKRGCARQMGFLIPLLLFAAIGLWCVMSQPQRKRNAILAGGGVAIVVLTLGGDRLGLHFDIVPALLALTVFSWREHTRRAVADALMTHPLSGLPMLDHLSLIKGCESCTIVTVKLERFVQRIAPLLIAERRPLFRAIAARINIMAPHHQVHQGDNGLFVFLIPPDDECQTDVIVRQLQALFTYDVIVDGHPYDVGASIGIMDDVALPFSKRLAVAIDRAEVGVFVTLRSVV